MSSGARSFHQTKSDLLIGCMAFVLYLLLGMTFFWFMSLNNFYLRVINRTLATTLLTFFAMTMAMHAVYGGFEVGRKKSKPVISAMVAGIVLTDLVTYLQLQIMNLSRFDIYWIHNVWDAPHWTEELAKYYEGRDDVPLLGVSNHNLSEIKQANDILKAHGLKLSAVQNHYSLINRSSEESGILDYCRENGIVFFAYMVLEQGALSGKYDTRRPMPEGSARAATYNPVLDKLEVLNAELKRLADKYGVGIAQIPVAWAIAKGTLPIIGVTKVSHVEDAVKAANVTLTDEETKGLEALADSLNLNVIRFWEKEMK